MEPIYVVLLIVFGIPIVMATLWALGFAATGIVGPFIAIWEDRHGWSRHDPTEA